MGKFTHAFLVGTVLAAWAPGAMAADQWLACDGTKTTTGKNSDGETLNDSTPVSDIYAFNDELQGLYFYSKDKKTLSPVKVTSYAPDEIKWNGDGVFGARWDGTLDRSNMSLNIVRTEKGKRSEWRTQCKATGAQPLA